MSFIALAVASIIVFAGGSSGSLLGTQYERGNLTLSFIANRKPVYYKLTNEEASKCRSVSPACTMCIQRCNFAPKSWEVARREYTVGYMMEIDRCHQEYSELKAGLPEWCMNDAKHFYPIPGFSPTKVHCSLMDKVACATRWVSEVGNEIRAQKLKNHKDAFLIARKAQYLARILKSLAQYTQELDELPSRIRSYQEEKQKNLLSQAYEHMKRPSEKQTVFAHPIFDSMDQIAEENRRLDNYISTNDIYMASLQNKFVRRDTVSKIPAFLNAISRLENRIHSKKADTNAYIQDIKDISERTAIFQEKATNLVYQTTHSKDVDGTVKLLDKELFELYVELRKERSILSNGNVKATNAKVGLIGMLRQLVREISEQQIRTGCSPNEIMSL